VIFVLGYKLEVEMESINLSKEETRVLKWLALSKNTSIKYYVGIIFFATIFIWIKHWDKFNQSIIFLIYNSIAWIALNVAAIFSVKYDHVVYELIMRLLRINEKKAE
jgi:hypothetical protein